MRRTQIILLLLLVAFGTGLRLRYGSWNLSSGRYWDERYTLDNVRQVYDQHTVAPVSGYYPSPVVSVPAAATLWASERLGGALGSPYDAMDDQGRFDPTAYRLLRGLQTFYGVLGIVFLFLVGRRAFSPATGLLAATLFTFMPWQVHASGYIKPDAQLVAFILLACYLALVAVDRPTWSRYAWAGMAVGLAASPKITGVLAAIPLAVATLWLFRHEPRRLLLAAWAGGISFLTFVLLNPFWRHYLALLSGLRRDYASRSDTTRGGIPELLLEQILDPYGLGLLAGLLAIGGILAWAVLVLARRRERGGKQPPQQGSSTGPSRLKVAMLLAFPVIFIPVYILQTPYFKGNNFLPVLAFMALAAAWATLALAAAVRQRVLARKGPLITAVLVIVVIAFSVRAGTRYVLHSVAPSTFDLATLFLRQTLRGDLGRVLVMAPVPEEKTAWEGRHLFGYGKSLIHFTEDPSTFSWRRLLGVDAVVAQPAYFEDPQSALGRLLAATDPHNVRHFERRGLTVHGTALTVVARRFRPRPDHVLNATPCPDTTTTDGCQRLEKPADARRRETWNLVLELAIATGSTSDETRAIELAAEGGPTESRPILLYPVSAGRWVSERFAAPETALEVRLPSDWSPVARTQAVLQALRWLPPRGTSRDGVQRPVRAAPEPTGTEATTKVPSPSNR